MQHFKFLELVLGASVLKANMMVADREARICVVYCS